MNFMAVAQPSNFTTLSDVETPQGSSSTASNNVHSRPRKKIVITPTKAANSLLLIAIVIFVISLGVALQRATTSTSTRASTDGLSGANGPESLLLVDKNNTVSISSYPKTYKGVPIPESLVTEAQRKYVTTDPELRKVFVINRIVYFYILKGVLEENNISWPGKGGELTWDSVEQQALAMEKIAHEQLVDTYEYSFIKAYSNNFPSPDKVNKEFGAVAGDVALQIMTEYAARVKAADSVQTVQNIVEESNQNEDLRILNADEPNTTVTDYTVDMNDISQQANYVFDEEFDSVLQTLAPYQASDLITLSDDNQVPYMYVVIYPTKVEKKKFPSFKQLIADKISEFSY